jgi:hypothetical protein
VTPEAELCGAPGLPEKRKDLRFHHVRGGLAPGGAARDAPAQPPEEIQPWPSCAT